MKGRPPWSAPPSLAAYAGAASAKAASAAKSSAANSRLCFIVVTSLCIFLYSPVYVSGILADYHPENGKFPRRSSENSTSTHSGE